MFPYEYHPHGVSVSSWVDKYFPTYCIIYIYVSKNLTLVAYAHNILVFNEKKYRIEMFVKSLIEGDALTEKRASMVLMI